MIVKQELLSAKMAIKDLSSTSPLPSASLVLVFGARDRFSDSKLASTLKARYPTAQIIGCSTAGEINGTGVMDDSIQITAVQWERTVQRVTHTKMSSMQDSFGTAVDLARQLKSDELKAVLVFSDGLHVNGSELLEGFKNVLGDVPVMGGMAGDGFNFSKTLQLFNDTVAEGLIIAVGLYGKHLIAATGVGRGWKPYGPPRKVTKSNKNVVIELDGKPALPLYNMYIGAHAAERLTWQWLEFSTRGDGRRQA